MGKRLIILILLIKLGIGVPAAMYFSDAHSDVLSIFSSEYAGKVADMLQPALERVDSLLAILTKDSHHPETNADTEV